MWRYNILHLKRRMWKNWSVTFDAVLHLRTTFLSPTFFSLLQVNGILFCGMKTFGWFITFKRPSSANFESAVLQLVDYLIHWYITLVRYENKEKRLSRSGETRYPFIRAIYVCVCVLCNAILQARKSQKLKCTRLIVVDFSRVFFFFKEYTSRFSISISSILISANIFLKCSLMYVACSSVIFLKKEN